MTVIDILLDLDIYYTILPRYSQEYLGWPNSQPYLGKDINKDRQKYNSQYSYFCLETRLLDHTD